MLRSILVRFPALGYPLYRRYWGASFASVGATQIITLGQGWLIFELSGSAWLLGLLGAAASIPNIVMTLVGGVIADRFDKRRVMLCTSASSAGLLATLAWLDAQGAVAVWHVLMIAALFSLITGIDWPARASMYPRLVERPAFMSAVALNSFIWQSSRMIMPALGGLLISVSDTSVLFTLGALGFATMFMVVATLPPQPSTTATGSAFEQLGEGLRFIWQTPLFRWLMGLTFVAMFLGQSFTQLMPVFADRLGSDETGYGYLLSAGGMGSVIGTLLIGSVQRHGQLGRVMLGAATCAALLTLIFASLTVLGWFWAAFAAALLVATCASGFNISSMTVLQLSVPDGLRGRVMGVHSMSFSMMPLGGLFLGALAEPLGAAAAVMVACTLYLVGIAFVAARAPMIRRLDGSRLMAHRTQPAH
ncbi:MAG: MFS transporter [Gammaproteobacteria bacterium]